MVASGVNFVTRVARTGGNREAVAGNVANLDCGDAVLTGTEANRNGGVAVLSGKVANPEGDVGVPLRDDLYCAAPPHDAPHSV